MSQNETFTLEQMIDLQGALRELNFSGWEVDQILSNPKKYLSELKSVVKGTHVVVRYPTIISKEIVLPSTKKGGPLSLFWSFKIKTELKGTKKGIFYYDGKNKWKKATVEFFKSKKMETVHGSSAHTAIEEVKELTYAGNSRYKLPGADISKHYSANWKNIPEEWPVDKIILLPGTIYLAEDGKRYIPYVANDSEDGPYEGILCMDDETLWPSQHVFMLLKFE